MDVKEIGGEQQDSSSERNGKNNHELDEGRERERKRDRKHADKHGGKPSQEWPTWDAIKASTEPDEKGPASHEATQLQSGSKKWVHSRKPRE